MNSPHDLRTASRPGLALPSGAEEALLWLRNALGTVAPRDPRTRRLGERRHRLDLLAELCERETFLLVTSWLGSSAVPSAKSKQDYADDIRMWSGVARELASHERFFLGCITPEMIETWTKVQQSKGAAPRTINRKLSTLTSFTKYAAWKLKDTTLASPVSKHDRLSVDPYDETTATPVLEKAEFQRVVAEATTPQQALIIVLIYTLAGRVSECCAAQLGNVQILDGEPKLNLTRKGGKGRVWPLPEELWALIQVATSGRTSGPLLVDDEGRAMDRHAVDRLLTKFGKRAGVLPGRELTPHVLRASRLTHMHDDNVKIEEIQKYADHASITTTLRYVKMRDISKLRALHARSATDVYSHLTHRFTKNNPTESAS